MKRVFLNRNTQGLTVHVLGMAGILTLFVLFFYFPMPPQFKRQGVVLTDEFLLILLCALVYFTFLNKHLLWKYAGLFFTILAIGLPLLRLWNTAGSTWNIVLGLLPWADAQGYYLDATTLLNGGLFSPFSGRRPLFASLLAGLLKICQGNLQFVLIIFSIVTGVSVFLFAKSIQRELGPIPAVLSIYLLQFFYRSYAGTTLTEQLGLSVGLLAFALLLYGVRQHHLWCFATGLTALTFALLARAGAFFILPGIFLFGVYHFSRRKIALAKIAGVLVVFALTPVLLNSLLGRLIASSDAKGFSNFSYTLYGQVVGGKGWLQVFNNHPEINRLQEPTLSQVVYRLALDEFMKNPFRLMNGILKAWADFIVPSVISVFSFLVYGQKWVDLLAQLLVTLFFILGIWFLWRNRYDPVAGLLLASSLGVFVSIPFVPPMDAGVRPYAGTMALIILLVAFGLNGVLAKFKISVSSDLADGSVWATETFVIMLMLSAVIGGIWVRVTAKAITSSPINCPAGLVSAHVRFMPGSFIQIVESDSSAKSKVPIVLIDDIRESLDTFPYGGFASILRKIRQPVLFTVTTDVNTDQPLWIMAPLDLLKYQGEVVGVCSDAIVSGDYSVLSIKDFDVP